MEAISVLIVDDSALMRSLIGKIVDSAPNLQIADKAMNGRFALQKIAKAKPDIIVLDIEMPEMNGIEFLKERKKIGLDIPVIILSSIAKEGAKVTMECLELGASDFVTKPSGSESADLHTVAAQLVEMLQGYGGQYQLKKIAGTARRIPEELLKSYESRLIDPETGHYQRKTGIESLHPGSPDLFHQDTAAARAVQTGKPAAAKPVPVRKPGPIEIIAIGISTGGPNALREVFAKIDPNLKQPIVVVQHMPAGFTEEFANSLNRICPLEVKEAQEGDLVKPGRILIAPGDKHLEVEKRPLASIAHITDAPPQNGHRPSADVLFGSIAREYQNRALGIIMTGMGRDGAAKLAELYAEGSRTLGQDEKSSIVYGMPRVAWELGGVMEQVSLSDMAEAINKYAREFAH
ncbi:chemotaxis response regulator protein-glutamate methylesterase [Treponema zuelzerae]|uniref:Protein-glutamate methylesterase/protein-glutamine glutaminase n=1 Tax=Teretinema zuelzerae TaxID=156 RepID=A0AAE3JID8_9SPIR|nr:chemotaxis response regulator protein-glutamate methylesterase [Teretinema zuelzerae]MBN2811124.1 chemotaxis response regulator protein-glutamate methylesterase [Spirochaetales bacterium]MCD1654163.1 chemotaxis response regulator protein-glutamate methylesterase [Teretinema zuelzerae]